MNRSGLVRVTVKDVLGLDHQVVAAASDIERITDSAFPSTYEGEHQLWRWQASSRATGPVRYAFGLEREETDASTWLGLVVGELGWDEAWQAGTLRVSGHRADLAPYLPLV